MRFRTIVAGVTLSFIAGHAIAQPSDMTMTLPAPLAEQQLSQYRGGFAIEKDYFINIGLSIITSVNGDTVLNSSIANLRIENGQLTVGQPVINLPVNIVQIGDGNLVDEAFPGSASALLDQALINVIQNTVDNSNIHLSTIVNIDAQVKGMLRQIESNNKLRQSLQYSLY